MPPPRKSQRPKIAVKARKPRGDQSVNLIQSNLNQSNEMTRKIDELGARMEAIFSAQQHEIEQIKSHLTRPYSPSSTIIDEEVLPERIHARSRREVSASLSPIRTASRRRKGKSPIVSCRKRFKSSTDGLRFSTNKEQVKFLGELNETVDDAQVLLEGGGSREEIKEVLDQARAVIRRRENSVRITDNYGFNVHRLFEAGSSLQLSSDEEARLQAAVCAQSSSSAAISQGRQLFRAGREYSSRNAYGTGRQGYQNGPRINGKCNGCGTFGHMERYCRRRMRRPQFQAVQPNWRAVHPPHGAAENSNPGPAGIA